MHQVQSSLILAVCHILCRRAFWKQSFAALSFLRVARAWLPYKVWAIRTSNLTKRMKQFIYQIIWSSGVSIDSWARHGLVCSRRGSFSDSSAGARWGMEENASSPPSLQSFSEEDSSNGLQVSVPIDDRLHLIIRKYFGLSDLIISVYFY